MKRVATTCVIALGFVLGGAATAHAGEYNGKGGPVPGGVNGKSDCSFSGRDVPDSVEGNPFPFLNDDALTSQRNFTQSYGLYISLGVEAPSHPGEACRGNAPSME